MKRLSTLALTTMSLLLLGVVLLAAMPSPSKSHSRSSSLNVDLRLKHQYPGDGSKTDRPNLKGIVIYTSDGHFAL